MAEGQRWSAGRKREVVLRLLRGESVDALSRELSIEIYRLEHRKVWESVQVTFPPNLAATTSFKKFTTIVGDYSTLRIIEAA